MAAVLQAAFRYLLYCMKISLLYQHLLKCVPMICVPMGSKGPIKNNRALLQIMVWCGRGDKAMSEPMEAKFTDAYMQH